MQYFDIDSMRIKIIPHIFLPDFKPGKTETNSLCLHICHSGNLSRERDPRNLLLAIKEFISNKSKELFLDVLGVASEEISRLVEELKLERNVKFISPLPYFEALKKMQEYDVLLILEALTGKGIFLPSKITDYTQLNKPILSLSPSLSEVGNILQRYGGGVVANNASIDDICEKLCQLDDLKSDNRLNELIENSLLYEYLEVDSILLQYKKVLTIF